MRADPKLASPHMQQQLAPIYSSKENSLIFREAVIKKGVSLCKEARQKDISYVYTIGISQLTIKM